MSEAIGPRVVKSNHETSGFVEPGSGVAAASATEADREIARLLNEADRRCRKVLTAHRSHLDRLAEVLAHQETLEQLDIESVLGDIRPDLAAI